MAELNNAALWGAYADAIVGLAHPGGVGGLGLTSVQRFAVSQANSYAIPVVPVVNQYYQNWNLYHFASIVPSTDSDIVLVDSGQDYDQSVALYTDNIFLQVPRDKKLDAEIVALNQRLTQTREELFNATIAANLQFLAFCPNGISPFTGQPIRFPEFLATFYPDILNRQKTIHALETVRNELELASTGGAQKARLDSWRDAVAKGVNSSHSFPNFNMPVVATEEAVIEQIANGTITANGQPTSYKPVWTIGGAFNRVAKDWIDTFPTDYPYDRARYEKGMSKVSTSFINVTNDYWKKYGYGETTKKKGSGLAFWKKKSSSTTTWSTTEVRINQTSFRNGITVNAWGVGTFPIQMGSWYPGNPLLSYPVLTANTPPHIAENLKEQVTSVLIGYGVETHFTLDRWAYDELSGQIEEARRNDGSMSILGNVYGKGDGGFSSTSNPWSNIKQFNDTNTFVLLAHNNKVPMVLGTTITRIASPE
ncbi:hypothetical protein MFIFM68171_02197 [Madurella fahalii]|uniref:Uncharacterized protein n=1 Tax=Madurella fahalii TaxID=1157608 RepID=A0ABQ0G2N2_9PEZI